MGSPEDFGNFINAVIDRVPSTKSRATSTSPTPRPMRRSSRVEDATTAWATSSSPQSLKRPTPTSRAWSRKSLALCLTVYVYDDSADDAFERILDWWTPPRNTHLTGAVFSQDRYALDLASKKLENAAGNFYLNDKPTGAVVGQQPFGGARGSGTNDKAGSYLNLLRWVSPHHQRSLGVSYGLSLPFLGLISSRTHAQRRPLAPFFWLNAQSSVFA